ncbi:phospholipase D-like domain-containing protein [Streptomyces sp. NPDC001787]|uniref:phospholipase D-like domain-containing protein n=1 Tax=Streptomyces sp. NPDC001787 TaxID=3154523 RepID=UPI003319E159
MPTFSPDSLLAVRFHNARPGLELAAIIDAALPVALITADVLAQDRKRLALLDEFVLRFVNNKVPSETAIAGMLGLSERMVSQTVADHFSADNLTYALPAPSQPGIRTLRLTARGEQTAREMAAITPVRVDQPVVYDQLLGKVRPYDRHTIIPHGQAEEAGMLILPAVHGALVEIGDISAGDINALLRERGNTDREVLQVRGVTQAKARRVMPAKLLVYADPDRTDIQLGVVVDGELSHHHEITLISLGGAASLGITVEPAAERPALEPELEKARVALPEVIQQRAEQAALQLGSAPPAPTAPAEPGPQYDEIRAIGVFEHPELLDDALTQARRRLLIISPWIKNAIVTTEFLSKLESRLTRGVRVHIAYGYDDSDAKTDQGAVRKLTNLAARYPAKFTFSRLKSTHAKVLVYDDVWVTTSFNWLSFQGDRDRTYRMEEGSLVRNRQITDTQHARYIELIDQQSW